MRSSNTIHEYGRPKMMCMAFKTVPLRGLENDIVVLTNDFGRVWRLEHILVIWSSIDRSMSQTALWRLHRERWCLMSHNSTLCTKKTISAQSFKNPRWSLVKISREKKPVLQSKLVGESPISLTKPNCLVEYMKRLQEKPLSKNAGYCTSYPCNQPEHGIKQGW